MNITHSERVLTALVIQHAMRMRRIGLSSVAFKALQNICILPHEGTIFERKKSF